MTISLRGRVQSGRQEAAGFLAVSWVVEQLRAPLGGAPYPGTLNLRLGDAASIDLWRRLQGALGRTVLRSPDPSLCDASCFRTLVADRVPALVVVPHVVGYPSDVVEVVATERLRSGLELDDGDEVALTFAEGGS